MSQPQWREVSTPKAPWSYGWTLQGVNMETILVGTKRLWIGHPPGGSIKEIVSTHHNPTAAGRVEMRWDLYSKGIKSSRDPVLLTTGRFLLQAYEVELFWKAAEPIMVTGYLQPLYMDFNIVTGIATSLGTMTMTILMGGEA